MKALAITHPGLEAISADEIKELLGRNVKEIKTEESVVFFDAKDHLDLCLLCYKAQSLIKVLLLFDSFSFKNVDDISSKANGIAKRKEFADFIGKKTRFMVKCVRVGEHDFSSKEVEAVIGGHIDAVVDLNSPEVTVYAYLFKNKCYIGVDFAGFDLSKRQYKIFNYKDSLKATVAYSMLRAAGYKKTDFLLDPFCSIGLIPIEAALYACNFPVNYYNKEKFAFRQFGPLKKTDFGKFFERIDREINLDEKTNIYGYDVMLGYVKAAQKNAKIAGINKKISVTRADIEWVETKVKEGEADKIVTVLPEITERNRKVMEKMHKEFFYQAEFVLKKKGAIVLVSNSKELVEKYSKEYRLIIKKMMGVMQGKKEMDIFVIQK